MLANPATTPLTMVESSFAVECCRRCLERLLPGWVERSVQVDDYGLFFLADNECPFPYLKTITVQLRPDQITGKAAKTLFAVTQAFERYLGNRVIVGIKNRNR